MIRYILNQEQHHAKTNFKDEYLKFLKEFKWIRTKDTCLNGWVNNIKQDMTSILQK